MSRTIASLGCLLLLSCSSVPGPAGPQGDPGPRGEAGSAADVSALQARVTEVETKLAAVKAPKVPHWIVTATGEDLGEAADGARAGVVWSDKLGGMVSYTPNDGLYFTSADCTGEGWLRSGEPMGILSTLPDGRVVSPSGAFSVHTFQSRSGDDGRCIPSGGASYSARAFVEHGRLDRLHSADELSLVR